MSGLFCRRGKESGSLVPRLLFTEKGNEPGDEARSLVTCFTAVCWDKPQHSILSCTWVLISQLTSMEITRCETPWTAILAYAGTMEPFYHGNTVCQYNSCGNVYLCCWVLQRCIPELSFAAHWRERLTRGYNCVYLCSYIMTSHWIKWR